MEHLRLVAGPSAMWITLMSSLLAGACGSPTEPARLGVTEGPRLVAGLSSTCVLHDGGIATCWGYLPGTFEPPAGSAGGFVSLTVGTAICGLTAEGRAYCWGHNLHGDVGDGSIGEARLEPTPVDTELRFARIVNSDYHTCGLTFTGEAWCWGQNDFGVLGNGKGAQGMSLHEPRPVRVASHVRFETMDLSDRTCALDLQGRAYCWGTIYASIDGGFYRAPGDCTSVYYLDYQGHDCLAPTPVAGDLRFVEISSGRADCGRTAQGEVYCWGDGYLGVLGHGIWGSGVYVVQPVKVLGGIEFASLAGGGTHVCGLTPEGRAYCWGNNFVGQLGNGESFGPGDVGYVTSPVPVPVSGDHRFVQLSSGGAHTCGLKANGEIWCWGSNDRKRFQWREQGAPQALPGFGGPQIEVTGLGHARSTTSVFSVDSSKRYAVFRAPSCLMASRAGRRSPFHCLPPAEAKRPYRLSR